MAKDVASDEVTDVNKYFKQHGRYVMCRKYGHTFRPTHEGYLVEGEMPNPISLYQRLLCNPDIGGCGLTAVDTFHPRTLERIGNRYIEYAGQPEYLARGTHISRQDARKWEARTFGFGEALGQSGRGRRKKAG